MTATTAPVLTPFTGLGPIHATPASVTIWGPEVPTLCGKSVAPWGTIWQPEAWPGMVTSGHPEVCTECAKATLKR